MLINYFKIAFRNLGRNKVFSFINIFGLAFGITCAILIGLWLQDEIQFNKIHDRQSQIHRILANVYWGEVATFNTLPGPLNASLKKDFPELQYVTSLSQGEVAMSLDKQTFKEKGYYATPDFLKIFSFPLLKGSVESALAKPDNIILTESLARKYFGDEDPIGQPLQINNKDLFQVSAVIQDPPRNSSIQFEWIMPFEYFEAANAWSKTWGNFAFEMYVMVAPETSLTNLKEKLLHYARKVVDPKADTEILLQPFSDMYLYGDFKSGRQDGGRIQYVRLFSIIACFIIVIACINFMNLTTARYTRRIKEVGIRKVNGAARRTLIIQFLGEALLSTVIAVLIAVMLAEILLPFFNSLTGKALEIDHLNMPFLFTLTAITIVTGLVSGSYPAFFLSAFKPASILKPIVVRSSGTNTLRRVLVVFQFSLAILMIIGTLTVYNQIQFIKNKNLGFEKENLLTMDLTLDIYNHRESFEEKLKQSEGIVSVTAIGDIPIDIGGTSADLSWPGKPEGQITSISATWVGYDYTKTLGVPLVSGRDFSRSKADSANYVVNEAAVKMMGLTDPIGATISFWNGTGKIIGVMKDFHLHSLHQSITPLILNIQPSNCSALLIRTEAGKTEEAIASLERVHKEFESSLPLTYAFMDDTYAQRYKSEMITAKLVNIFAVVAVVISCLGLFGLATFTAEQRTKEIGVRKVLGASMITIVRLLSKDYLKLVVVAFVVICPVAYYAVDKWLEQFAYRTTISAWVFILTGVVSVMVALLTISIQTLRAASANPAESLRNE